MAESNIPGMKECQSLNITLPVFIHRYYCSKIQFNGTTCLPFQTVDELHTIKTLCEAADIIWTVGFWFSMVTGILGNSLAILTLLSLPRSPATFFVGLLAFSDIIALCLFAVTHYLDKYKILNRTSMSWDFTVMTFDFSFSFCNWLLVLICVERLFTVRFPLRKRYYFTLRHAQWSTLILALVLLVVYVSATWTIGYNSIQMFQLRIVMFAFLPLTLILIIIALISYQLRRIHNDRKILNGRVHSRLTLSRVEEIQNTSNGQNKKRRSLNMLDEIARLENSITVMMLVAAVCFSVLIIPNGAVLISYKKIAVSMNTPVLRARFILLMKISQVLTILNLSMNFLLYFLSAKRFRSQLYKVILPRTLSFGRKPSQATPGINNSISDTSPIHHGINGDYIAFHLGSEMNGDRNDETMEVQFDSGDVSPEHHITQTPRTYPILYSELNHTSGSARV